MVIYCFWLDPLSEGRSKKVCWVSIDLSHLSAVGDPNPLNQALYLDRVPYFVSEVGAGTIYVYIDRFARFLRKRCL